jgi:hypothetical protein
MDVQTLTNGKTIVTYGSPMEYQSPLMVDEVYPSVVTYKCAVTRKFVGKVYKTADGRWWLTSVFLPDGNAVEVFSKIEGFQLLNTLHKQHHEH